MIRDEVRGGVEAIARASGRAGRGFRAPGYTITDAVFDALAAEGVTYDSSVFPCPMYWGAKDGEDRADPRAGPRSQLDRRHPDGAHRPGGPVRPGPPLLAQARGALALLELPIGVTRGARLPYIGTSMAAGPERRGAPSPRRSRADRW